jgi:Fe2+ or Zn2+ uptake regulation protein
MSYLDDTFFPHLRLLIIQLLHEQPAERANDQLLIDAVQATGLPATADQVRTALSWLTEQGVLEKEPLQRFTIYGLTERARDHLARRTRLDGVRRPGV